MKVKDVHSRSFAVSSELSRYYFPTMITPAQVIDILNRAGIKFVLAGAHGLGGWLEKPRASEDVDVVVMTRHEKKAVRALLEAFPQLQAEDHEAVIRLRDPQTKAVLIDLMKQRALYREVFKHVHEVKEGKRVYRIPSLEMAITMKFAAMLSPNRADEDKFIDAHDFMHMIKRHPELDLVKLHSLGELASAGGGKRLLGLVEDVRAGRKLVL